MAVTGIGKVGGDEERSAFGRKASGASGTWRYVTVPLGKGKPFAVLLPRKPEFNRRGNRRLLEGSRALRTEFVALDSNGCAAIVTAHNTTIDHQFHRADIVEQNRPTHGK